jgi:hypothetical protein
MNRGPVVDVSVNRKAVWGGAMQSRVRLSAVLLVAALSTTSCGDVVREGTGSSYLIMNALEAASGAEPGRFSGTLNSDVITVVDNVASVFNDIGRARITLAMKDPGGPDTPTTPTTNNFITISRYRVRYTRADGRNTPGVDVPYGFDGAVTATVSGGEASIGFELVRHIAKEEAPLQALAFNSAVIISTITEVTFFGRDQTGREVSVTGTMLVNFGNFGDPR